MQSPDTEPGIVWQDLPIPGTCRLHPPQKVGKVGRAQWMYYWKDITHIRIRFKFTWHETRWLPIESELSGQMRSRISFAEVEKFSQWVAVVVVKISKKLEAPKTQGCFACLPCHVSFVDLEVPCMRDCCLHVLHLPLRNGWTKPRRGNFNSECRRVQEILLCFNKGRVDMFDTIIYRYTMTLHEPTWWFTIPPFPINRMNLSTSHIRRGTGSLDPQWTWQHHPDLMTDYRGATSSALHAWHGRSGNEHKKNPRIRGWIFVGKDQQKW